MPHQTTPLLYDTPAAVQDLAATRDPVVRNLQIIQPYYDTSNCETLSAIIRGPRRNAYRQGLSGPRLVKMSSGLCEDRSIKTLGEQS